LTKRPFTWIYFTGDSSNNGCVTDAYDDSFSVAFNGVGGEKDLNPWFIQQMFVGENHAE
jgi:hypothetical protein